MGEMGKEVQEGLRLWIQTVTCRIIFLYAFKCGGAQGLPSSVMQFPQELFRPARSQHYLGLLSLAFSPGAS